MFQIPAATCPACRAAFICGAAGGHCWCMELPAWQGEDESGDCLCPACLRQKLAEQEARRR